MSRAESLEFHFIELLGDITGEEQAPACAAAHHSLSINKQSVSRLIATRENGNTGSPLPATTPSPMDDPIASDEALGSPLPEAEADQPAPTSDTPETAGIAREPQVHDQPQLPASESQAPQSESPAAEDISSAPRTFLTSLALGADFSLPLPPSQADTTSAYTDTQADAQETKATEAVEGDPAVAPESEPLHALDEAAARGDEPDADMPAEPEDTAAVLEPQAEPSSEKDAPRAPHAAVTSLSNDTDTVLSDVQSTLNSLADMAKGLTQQKQDAARLQENLDQRKAQLNDRERQLADKEDQLRLLETRLAQEVSTLERNAEDNARALTERSAALKALAENVEARDRATAKMADNLRLERQRNDELSESLQRRTDALDEREAMLNRKDDELAESLKQLVGAKDRFRALVRTFNETVQFNNTLNAISGKALDD